MTTGMVGTSGMSKNDVNAAWSKSERRKKTNARGKPISLRSPSAGNGEPWNGCSMRCGAIRSRSPDLGAKPSNDENGNPRLHGLTADGAVLLAESRNPYTFIIEYAQSRGDTVGHVHTTWRDFEGDFGLNLAGTQ